MRHSLKLLAASAAFALAGLVASNAAAAVTIVPFSDDATSGISASNTYTHAVDYGDDNTAATINGVPFTFYGSSSSFSVVNTEPAGTVFNAYDASNTLENGSRYGVHSTPTFGGGGVEAMLRDFVYHSTTPAAGVIGTSNYQTLTLSGLTPGQTYDFRVYYRPWTANDNRTVTLSFGYGDPFAETTSINEDAGAIDNNAHYASFVYTATDSTFTLATASTIATYNWHVYGITNQEVVPEPAALSLLGLSGLALLRRRR